MIKKIVLRDIASYDHNGVTFDNLARVNFIYGGNGTVVFQPVCPKSVDIRDAVQS